jgi:hypothetical protein
MSFTLNPELQPRILPTGRFVFPDIFSDEIAREIEIPAQVKDLEYKIRVVVSLGNDFESFKKYLLGRQ